MKYNYIFLKTYYRNFGFYIAMSESLPEIKKKRKLLFYRVYRVNEPEEILI